MAKDYVVKQQKNNSGSHGSAQFKANLKFFGMSLISNDTCVEARKKPWYAAVIIVVVSTILAMASVMYSAFKTTGASFLDAPLYGIDTGLSEFDKALAANNLSAKVQNHTLTIDDSAWKAAFPDTKTGETTKYNPCNAYVHQYQEEQIYLPTSYDSSSSSVVSTTPTKRTVTVTDFAVYWAGATSLDTYYTESVWGLAVGFPTADSKTNILVLGEKGFKFYKLPTTKAAQTSKLEGKWDSSYIEGFDLKDLATTSTHGATYAAGDVDKTLASWKEILADGYNSTKITSAWITTGIYFGVYAGLALLLGLTVFLMTRGKTNPFRIYTFWECQKIAYWAAFSPSVLALIGFAFPAYAPLVYIFLYGMRVMWMSMRSLRPVYNEQ
jgi:hypothetical protein